ncbi:formimidoyltransferase-cyclodeaminase [Pelobates fuscus]|uniref:formimidoyltransferase-cyclodeaminase n=1 Tax=Pelobates fuscus TaxID=191477 RepID=UPI002FE483BD
MSTCPGHCIYQFNLPQFPNHNFTYSLPIVSFLIDGTWEGIKEKKKKPLNTTDECGVYIEQAVPVFANMSKLVECVPNFSEGRNKETIDALAAAISQTGGCRLLDVDPGPSTNRTVFTFVGNPEAVIEGALNAARVAFQMIDMRKHKGEHPRMGALDVCPFIPVRNVTMEECVTCANRFAERLSEELHVPVYLYGEAARSESRRSLPAVRAGEYEGLHTKLQSPEWAPDYGKPIFIPSWGASVCGARKFLIAYNVNLLTTKELAHRIALNIREGGRGKEQPGSLKKVQALGWFLEEENLAQVSANLLDYEISSLHMVYEEICKDAKELNLPVLGSQLVGLIPLRALMDSAEFYIKQENLFILEEEHKLRLAINRLGLDSLSPFEPRKRIIEYLVQDDCSERALVKQTVETFVHSVRARSATPGGGSVSAAVAAMGAALGCMVGQMTYGKRQFESLDGVMRELIPPFHTAVDHLLCAVDADSNAFGSYMAALKLPKRTAEEQQKRSSALQEGLKEAIGVPLRLAEKINTLWQPLLDLSKHGNIACISDLQVAAKALETGVSGAYFNVLINLKEIGDAEFKMQTRNKVSQLLDEAKSCMESVLRECEARV